VAYWREDDPLLASRERVPIAIPDGPSGDFERDGLVTSLYASLSRILVVVLEEENEILRREKVIGLKTNCMN
jgi:hypothetical protein